MRVYSWNVNGIRSVLAKGALQDFINEHSPDILCLQETKAERGQVEIDLPEYREYWNSAAKKGYSGTAIFTKVEPNQVVNGLPKEVITEYKVHGDVYGDPNKEGRVITTEFEKFFVVNVYTINIKDDLSRLGLRQAWDRAFLEYCKSLEKKKPVIFCGDFERSPQRRGFSQTQRERWQKGLYQRGKSRLFSASRTRFYRFFQAISQRQRILHLVDALGQRPDPQRRLARRLHPGFGQFEGQDRSH